MATLSLSESRCRDVVETLPSYPRALSRRATILALVGVLNCAPWALAQEVAFLRGDANQDGGIDLSDALATLEQLFLARGEAECEDALDSNDDGGLDVSDPVALLNYLFLGAVVPPPPGVSDCGLDPTKDALDCLEFRPCVAAVEARVVAVRVSGSPEAYTFAVTIESPETGCEQYADWWEVVSVGGELLYRRVLLHSHVNEQPFTRSGGPVRVGGDTTVYVRAHMNTSGYGTQVLMGTPAGGFEEGTLEVGRFGDLAAREPLPVGCAF